MQYNLVRHAITFKIFLRDEQLKLTLFTAKSLHQGLVEQVKCKKNQSREDIKLFRLEGKQEAICNPKAD